MADSDSERPLVVLGQEMAAARAAEEKHIPSGPSPLASHRYAPEHHDLVDFVDSPLDGLIRSLAAGYRLASGSERQLIRDSLTQRDLYAIFAFARRAALTSIRSSNSDAVRSAVVALAAVDVDRTDWRDLAWAVDITIATLIDLGESPDDALSEAARLSNSNLAGRLNTRTSLADALYLKYESGSEIGLIRRGINDYAPSTDLVAGGLALTRMFRAHGLMPDLEVSTSFPHVWFGAKPKRRSQVPTGALTVRCLYADDPDQHQHLVAFLGEFRSTGTARRRESAANAHNRGQHARLAVRVDTVLCLVIGRSIIVGVPQRENDTSLARFETEIRSVLSDG